MLKECVKQQITWCIKVIRKLLCSAFCVIILPTCRFCRHDCIVFGFSLWFLTHELSVLIVVGNTRPDDVMVMSSAWALLLERFITGPLNCGLRWDSLGALWVLGSNTGTSTPLCNGNIFVCFFYQTRISEILGCLWRLNTFFTVFQIKTKKALFCLISLLFISPAADVFIFIHFKVFKMVFICFCCNLKESDVSNGYHGEIRSAEVSACVGRLSSCLWILSLCGDSCSNDINDTAVAAAAASSLRSIFSSSLWFHTSFSALICTPFSPVCCYALLIYL